MQSSSADVTTASRPSANAAAPTLKWSFIAMLVAVAATSALGINIYLPSMPGMATAFGVDFATIQLTLSLYLAAVAVGQVIVGPLSDRFGRRPVLLVGLGLFAAGSLICLLAPNIGVLLVGRIIQALGGCAGITLSRAVVRDIFGRDQAASMIGYVTMGMAVAPMLAPTIGGGLEALYGWRASFLFLLVFGVLTLFAVFRLLHETNHRRGPGGSAGQLLRGYVRLVACRQFWGYTLSVAFSSGVFFSFVAGASYVMINIMGRSPLEYGLYFGMVPGGYMLGNFLSGRFAHRFGANPLILSGALLVLASVGVMAAAFAAGWAHPAALFVPMFFVGLGNGLVIPSGVAGAISVDPNVAGAAAGLTGSFQMGFGAVAAPLVGALLVDSAWPMIGVMAVSALFALLSFGLARNRAMS